MKERSSQLIILCRESVLPIFTKFHHFDCENNSGHELGARLTKASYNRMQLLCGAVRITKTETILSNKQTLFYNCAPGDMVVSNSMLSM